tara:strand:- start:188 stop:376 length:189 start_codon:yes stop_codon:yes gene_type:complete
LARIIKRKVITKKEKRIRPIKRSRSFPTKDENSKTHSIAKSRRRRVKDYVRSNLTVKRMGLK